MLRVQPSQNTGTRLGTKPVLAGAEVVMVKARHLAVYGALLLAGSFNLSTAERNTRQMGTTKSLQTLPNQTPINPRVPDSGNRNEPENPMHERMEEAAAKARNSERFKRIQSDTEKLVKLSLELKEDVDKSTKNEMSLDVIRKAAEIEKLAHDVKERMKG